MIDAVRRFFQRRLQTNVDEPGDAEQTIHLATAALLVEMMRSDWEVKEEERGAVLRTIRDKFGLGEEEANELMRLAEDRIWQATGYYEFTSLVNRECTYEQKVRIIEELWEVAHADAEMDKHEEHMVRKVADLIHVAHDDFIAAKLKSRRK